jgi:glycosyltransferase involved in cell wall biosynthesis
VLVVTLDVLAERMAGPAIRAWQLAEQLSREHEVVLASTKPLGLPPGVLDVRHAEADGLVELVEWCEVLVFQGFVLQQYPFLAREDRIVIVDAYAPLYLEQLEQAKALGPVAHAHVVRGGVDTINAQLARADFVMCASEKQRDLWLGTLGALGRINPSTYTDDPTLRRLVDVVPFGLPATPPRRLAPAVKGVVPGIGVADHLVLWGGGVYEWFDPLTLLRAMALLADERPDIKLFFLGLVHPNPDVGEMDMAGAARRLSGDLGLTGKTVFFNETWVPYGRRGDYLLEADVAVSTHLDHVETAFSFRTRVLDYLWAAAPMVLTRGDALGDLVGERGAGLVVPPADPEALRNALLAVLEPTQARRCSEVARQLARQYEWEHAARPLLEWMAAARPAADRGTSAPRVGTATAALGTFARLRRDAAVARAHVGRGGLRALLPPLKRRLRRR